MKGERKDSKRVETKRQLGGGGILLLECSQAVSVRPCIRVVGRNTVRVVEAQILSKCYLRIQSVPQRNTTLHHYNDQLVNAV
jgi:hypothetical protein